MVNDIKLIVSQKVVLWLVVMCCKCQWLSCTLKLHYLHGTSPLGGLLLGMLPHNEGTQTAADADEGVGQ